MHVLVDGLWSAIVVPKVRYVCGPSSASFLETASRGIQLEGNTV